jgi:hypothetical protein
MGGRMSYTISIEPLTEIYKELEPICREHYEEMCVRLRQLGIFPSEYNPRLDEYFRASAAGYLKTFIVRFSGKIVGYSNIYFTNDMHNHDKICSEDVVFVTKLHRKGIGRKLTQYGLQEMKKLGCTRFQVTTQTDPRVSKLLGRMGFKDVGRVMVYTF